MKTIIISTLLMTMCSTAFADYNDLGQQLQAQEQMERQARAMEQQAQAMQQQADQERFEQSRF